VKKNPVVRKKETWDWGVLEWWREVRRNGASEKKLIL